MARLICLRLAEFVEAGILRRLPRKIRHRFRGLPGEKMKPQDRYLKFVRWEEDDHAYVGYCPDLFPWGGVCHADREEEVYRTLCELVMEEIEQLEAAGKPLPSPTTRAMREAV